MTTIYKKLKERLPEEDFEGQMLVDSFDILENWILDMKGVIRREP